jgi:hypothetical protein
MCCINIKFFYVIATFSFVLWASPSHCLAQITPQKEISISGSDNVVQIPTVYRYNSKNGTIDEQTRAQQNKEKRYLEIRRNRSGSNSGYYAIAALFFVTTAFFFWRQRNLQK